MNLVLDSVTENDEEEENLVGDLKSPRDSKKSLYVMRTKTEGQNPEKGSFEQHTRAFESTIMVRSRSGKILDS